MKFALATIAAPAANEQNIDALIASLENMQAAQASLEAWGYTDRWKRAFDPEGILVAMTGIEPSVEGFTEGVKNTVAKIIEWIKVLIRKIKDFFTGDKTRLRTAEQMMAEAFKDTPELKKLFHGGPADLQKVAVFTKSVKNEKVQLISLDASEKYIDFLITAFAVNTADQTFDANELPRMDEFRAKAETLAKGILVDVWSVFDSPVGWTPAKFDNVAKKAPDVRGVLLAFLTDAEARLEKCRNTDPNAPTIDERMQRLSIGFYSAGVAAANTCLGVLDRIFVGFDKINKRFVSEIRMYNQHHKE